MIQSNPTEEERVFGHCTGRQASYHIISSSLHDIVIRIVIAFKCYVITQRSGKKEHTEINQQNQTTQR